MSDLVARHCLQRKCHRPRRESRIVIHDIDNVEQVVIGRSGGVVGIGRIHRIEFVDLKLGLIEQGFIWTVVRACSCWADSACPCGDMPACSFASMLARAVGLLRMFVRPVTTACMSVLNSVRLVAFKPPAERSLAALNTAPTSASVGGAAELPSAALTAAAISLPVGSSWKPTLVKPVAL